MRRAAQLLARVLMAMLRPAYYSWCAILTLQLIGAVHINWLVIVGLALYAPTAIAVDIAVKALTVPLPPTEPGGSPGTEG